MTSLSSEGMIRTSDQGHQATWRLRAGTLPVIKLFARDTLRPHLSLIGKAKLTRRMGKQITSDSKRTRNLCMKEISSNVSEPSLLRNIFGSRP